MKHLKYDYFSLKYSMICTFIVVVFISGFFSSTHLLGNSKSEIKANKCNEQNPKSSNNLKKAEPDVKASESLGQKFQPFSNYAELDPFMEMYLIQKRMDRLFESTFNRFRKSPGFVMINPKKMLFAPRIDLKDDGSSYIIKMDIPGVDKPNIKIMLRNRNVTISGKRVIKKQKKTDKMVTMERRLGEFSRTFSLPGAVDKDKITALCKDGVLTVTFPKIATKNEEIEIKIKEE